MDERNSIVEAIPQSSPGFLRSFGWIVFSEGGLLVEDRVLAFVFRRLDLDPFHFRGIGPTLCPLDQPADIERISLRNSLDASIRAIAHPAGHLELLGAQPHRFAEEDALDEAGDS